MSNHSWVIVGFRPVATECECVFYADSVQRQKSLEETITLSDHELTASAEPNELFELWLAVSTENLNGWRIRANCQRVGAYQVGHKPIARFTRFYRLV